MRTAVALLVSTLVALLGACTHTRTSSQDVTDAAVISCANGIQFDRMQLAFQLRAQSLTPTGFLVRAWDRTRKLDRCRQDPAWAKALGNGDKDGDRVPDSMDRCPDTPPLTATDDNGCPTPDQQLSGAPSPENVKKALDGYGFMAEKTCDGAPVPRTPGQILANVALFRAPFPPDVTAELIRPTNQPPKCHLFYEIELYGPATSGGITWRFLFRDTEDQQIGQPTARFERTHPPGAWPSNRLQWRVRVMNGNGVASDWSALSNGTVFRE